MFKEYVQRICPKNKTVKKQKLNDAFIKQHGLCALL